VPENLREEFIAAVTQRYVAKHPPDADGKVHVKMVRLEIDAVKFKSGCAAAQPPKFQLQKIYSRHGIKLANSISVMMKKSFKEIPGSIVAPKGFRASGVFCDIKKLGTGKGSNKGQKRDLALIVSETPATVAGMFTTNQVCAAPVKICVERVKKRGRAQASS
jgi:hypothetical protein